VIENLLGEIPSAQRAYVEAVPAKQVRAEFGEVKPGLALLALGNRVVTLQEQDVPLHRRRFHSWDPLPTARRPVPEASGVYGNLNRAAGLDRGGSQCTVRRGCGGGDEGAEEMRELI
jgi:hypothetical protein